MFVLYMHTKMLDYQLKAQKYFKKSLISIITNKTYYFVCILKISTVIRLENLENNNNGRRIC